MFVRNMLNVIKFGLGLQEVNQKSVRCLHKAHKKFAIIQEKTCFQNFITEYYFVQHMNITTNKSLIK